MNKYVLLAVLALFIVAGGGWYLYGRDTTGPAPEGPAPLDAFAQCLQDKKVTMYGADWCSHCQNEKKGFGSSFRLVPYVECPDNPDLCVSKGVEGYPTWILEDGTKLVGEQGLAKLSAVSGCALP